MPIVNSITDLWWLFYNTFMNFDCYCEQRFMIHLQVFILVLVLKVWSWS